MFGLLIRCNRLERRVLALEGKNELLSAQLYAKAMEAEDAQKCIAHQAQGLAKLKEEMSGIPRDPMDPIAAALEAVVLDLGCSEWATPEHAEIILQSLIDRHYNRAWTALFTAPAPARTGGA